jgi:hypothetical protein
VAKLGGFLAKLIERDEWLSYRNGLLSLERREAKLEGWVSKIEGWRLS